MIISMKEVKKFIICVLIPVLVGFLSFLISNLLSDATFSMKYIELIKPTFAPSESIYKTVWPILYVLMGISFYIIITKKASSQKVIDAKFVYYLQLILNFLWSLLFFGLNLRFVALIDLFVLLFVVIIMIYKFFIVDKKAAALNIPYVFWTTFALILNYFIWILNK